MIFSGMWTSMSRGIPLLCQDICLVASYREPSMYLDKLLTRPQRSALAKFRMGTFPIAIETGRYIGKPEPERL